MEELGKRGADGVRVVLGIGAECRLGRWKTVKGDEIVLLYSILGYLDDCNLVISTIKLMRILHNSNWVLANVN